MPEYRHKKSNNFQAFQFNVDPTPDWFQEEIDNTKVHPSTEGKDELKGKGVLLMQNKEGKKFCHIETVASNTGLHVIESGDYILKTSNGDLLPMLKKDFEIRYEKVN